MLVVTSLGGWVGGGGGGGVKSMVGDLGLYGPWGRGQVWEVNHYHSLLQLWMSVVGFP